MTNAEFRILVVDDEKTIAQTTAILLEKAGFQARPFFDPVDALAQAADYKPHLLISDVMMPGMSGVELALAVRKAWPDCKTLMMTSKIDAGELLSAALKQGHDFALLQKPVPVQALIRFVNETAQKTLPA